MSVDSTHKWVWMCALLQNIRSDPIGLMMQEKNSCKIASRGLMHQQMSFRNNMTDYRPRYLTFPVVGKTCWGGLVSQLVSFRQASTQLAVETEQVVTSVMLNKYYY